MNRNTRRLIFTHILLAALLILILLVPNTRRGVHSPVSFLAAIGLMELLFLASVFRQKKKTGTCGTGPFDIISFVWILLSVWELISSILDKVNPVLFPCPENVFETFTLQWRIMLTNARFSLQLLFSGFFLGMLLAVGLGLIAGWIPRVRVFAYPIANVMAPIPAIVISPYLVSVLPTFRSASIAVIVLGVFWPNFLSTINRVSSMEPQILDSARMLKPSNSTMILKILLPYIFPGVVGGLRVSLTTSLLMLNFAELMGATHGLGYYIQNCITYANYTRAVAGIIMIGIVVTLLNLIVTWLQRILIRWH